jgi:glycosyltransferase involved in cell wall biosynthesis
MPDQKKLPVSVCLIAGNEAQRIPRALASVAHWAAEIIVVLNADVNDGTDKIAEAHGARVFREPWKGHIAQKNSAAQKATQEWILGLDADEEVSPELCAEIQQLFARPDWQRPFAAFSFPRCTFYCDRWIRHGDWYPDRKTRLWRRGSATWGGIDPHDKLIVQGRVGRLRSDLRHFSHESINRQIQKLVPFSDDFVKHRRTAGRSVTFMDLAIRPWWRFFRAYVVRRGFLDGWPGYYIAWFNAFSAITRYAKVREAESSAVTNTSPKLAVIINTFDRPDYLARVLQAVARQTVPPDEVILADDGSAEETRRLFSEWSAAQKHTTAHVWQKHDGFRRAQILNQAVAAARSDYLVFLDGDTLPHPQFVADHRALARPDAFVQGHRALIEQKASAWFGLGELFADRRRALWLWQIGSLKNAWRWPFAWRLTKQNLHGTRGCNLAIWRRDLLRVNGYNEDFVGWGREDSELTARLINAGLKRLDVRGRALCYHLWHPPAARAGLSANDTLLQNTIARSTNRCERGLNLHL